MLGYHHNYRADDKQEIAFVLAVSFVLREIGYIMNRQGSPFFSIKRGAA
jgi:hypothetical protein